MPYMDDAHTSLVDLLTPLAGRAEPSQVISVRLPDSDMARLEAIAGHLSVDQPGGFHPSRNKIVQLAIRCYYDTLAKQPSGIKSAPPPQPVQPLPPRVPFASAGDVVRIPSGRRYYVMRVSAEGADIGAVYGRRYMQDNTLYGPVEEVKKGTVIDHLEAEPPQWQSQLFPRKP